MTWLALLLIGLGLADLGHALRPVRWLPEVAAAALTVALAALAGVHGGRDIVAWVLIAAAVVGWGLVVRVGFGADRAGLPLAYLLALVVLALATTPWGQPHHGAIGDWLDATPIPLLHGLGTDRALLLLGGALVQGSTGNVLVRLVLLATHTINPVQAGEREPGPRLKGGRLLGPMERLVILGLGVAGDYTAAGIVVAAKGLLRYPELQAAREEVDIAAVTEYFLVGSFVSWLVSLTTLVLLAR